MNSPYLSLLKELQTTITYNDINGNLVRLTEAGIIKDKPSNSRNSYYLIDDSTDIDSKPAILTIANNSEYYNNWKRCGSFFFLYIYNITFTQKNKITITRYLKLVYLEIKIKKT